MQAILLVTVFSCLLAAALAVGAVDVALEGDCTFANGGRSNCADANAICTPQGTPKCKCKDGYEKSGANCIAEHTFEATCTPSGASNGDCLDVNAVCSASNKCECKPGYTGTAGGKCAGAALDATCIFANEGQSNCDDANAICTPQNTPKCKCKDGYEKSGTICIAKNTFGAACTPADGSKGDCSDVNAICLAATNKCDCKPGYTGTAGGKCAAKNEGSAPGHLSIWMLCTSFMTMSLAVHVM